MQKRIGSKKTDAVEKAGFVVVLLFCFVFFSREAEAPTKHLPGIVPS